MLLHSSLCEVEDHEFDQLIDELHHCVGWARDDTSLTTLWYLLSAIVVEDSNALAANRLPTEGILLTKTNKLSPGAVYDVCRELTFHQGTHIESFDGKTVLSLIKACFPKPPRTRKSTRNQLRHQANVRLIRLRRANGDL